MGIFDLVNDALGSASGVISDPSALTDQVQEIIDPSQLTDKVGEVTGAVGEIGQQVSEVIGEPLSVVEDFKNSIGF
jgi:hypothetical protein